MMSRCFTSVCLTQPPLPNVQICPRLFPNPERPICACDPTGIPQKLTNINDWFWLLNGWKKGQYEIGLREVPP